MPQTNGIRQAMPQSQKGKGNFSLALSGDLRVWLDGYADEHGVTKTLIIRLLLARERWRHTRRQQGDTSERLILEENW